MSKFLTGCAISLAVAWAAAEVVGRAIVYSDDDREASFEACKASGGGNFGCVLDSMSSNDDGDLPWGAQYNLREGHKIGNAWYNGSLTDEQKNTYKSCIEESENYVSKDYEDIYIRKRSARESLKGCVIGQLKNE